MSGLSFEFILRRDCDEPHCSTLPREQRTERIDWIRWTTGYAESERETDQPKAVLLGNWNDWSRRATDLLERAGYALEWEDEWAECDGCGKAVRTSPDSYSWEPRYVQTDDGLCCAGCVDAREYLESIEDDERKCCFSWIDPGEHGYERVSAEEEYESGWHPGQTDSPAEVLAELHAQGIQHVVFRSPHRGQFDVRFETWRRVQEQDDSEQEAGS